MTVGAKLAAYAATLVATFAALFALGNTVGPRFSAPASAPRPATGASDTDLRSARSGGPLGLIGADGSSDTAVHGAGHGAGHSESHGSAEATDATDATATDNGPATDDGPGGLSVSQDGFTLAPLTTTTAPGQPQQFSFRITGPDGLAVHDYELRHDRELHLIVVRRDLVDYQHLHPVRDEEGNWSVPLTLPQAGTYRAFADFKPAGADDLTLGVDLSAPGDYQPAPAPPASAGSSTTAQVDGYTVTMTGGLRPGLESTLSFDVRRDGQPVDLQPHLGALGHLVALREGDLAYLHVHPEGSHDARSEVRFGADVPTAGNYALFLDFKQSDSVHTAEFRVAAR